MINDYGMVVWDDDVLDPLMTFFFLFIPGKVRFVVVNNVNVWRKILTLFLFYFIILPIT